MSETSAVTGMIKAKPHRPAIVLVSGGLDSATTLAIARDQGFVCHALSFDYGQRHRVELDAARRVGQHAGVLTHRWVRIDLHLFDASRSSSGFLGSALIDDIEVPKDRDASAMSSQIPVTYVPARNTLFLSYAVAFAEVIGAGDIFIGVNAIDYSGYPDCRPEYIRAFEQMANLATKSAVEGQRLRIHSPLIDLTKVEIIRRGLALDVDFSLTHSCYDPEQGKPCGRCDACRLRQDAFEALGMNDPEP